MRNCISIGIFVQISQKRLKCLRAIPRPKRLQAFIDTISIIEKVRLVAIEVNDLHCAKALHLLFYYNDVFSTKDNFRVFQHRYSAIIPMIGLGIRHSAQFLFDCVSDERPHFSTPADKEVSVHCYDESEEEAADFKTCVGNTDWVRLEVETCVHCHKGGE